VNNSDLGCIYNILQERAPRSVIWSKHGRVCASSASETSRTCQCHSECRLGTDWQLDEPERESARHRRLRRGQRSTCSEACEEQHRASERNSERVCAVSSLVCISLKRQQYLSRHYASFTEIPTCCVVYAIILMHCSIGRKKFANCTNVSHRKCNLYKPIFLEKKTVILSLNHFSQSSRAIIDMKIISFSFSFCCILLFN